MPSSASLQSPAPHGMQRGMVSAPKAQWLKSERVVKRQSAVDEMALQVRAYKLPEPEREHMFAMEQMRRKWRFDFAFMQQKVALEVEGLVVRKVDGQVIVSGRHATVDGMRNDMEKYAYAALLGWTLLRFEQVLIREGTAIDLLTKVLRSKGWRPGDK